MTPRAIRRYVAALLALALVAPGLIARLSVRSRAAPERVPRTLEADVGAVFLEPARPEAWGASYQFEFTNPSRDATARLRLLHNSCGCASCLIEKAELAPGERSRIQLAMSVPYSRQERREWAIIETGLAEEGQIIVALAASFYPRIAIEMEPLPETPAKPGSTQTLRVTSTAYQPAKEKPARVRLVCTYPGARVRAAGPAEVVERGQVRRVVRRWQVELSESAAEGASLGEEGSDGKLAATYGRWRAVRDLPWRQKTPITASPGRVVLQPEAGGVAAVEVLLASQQAFAILGIEAAEGLSVRYTDSGAASRHALAVEAAWDASAGLARKGQVVITTDHRLQPRVVLPVYVLYLGS